MKQDDIDIEDDLCSEYDFSDGIRGKHFQAYRVGTNLVALDPDVAKVFSDASIVNETLRNLIKIAAQYVSVKAGIQQIAIT